jgi:hypothetical protein
MMATKREPAVREMIAELREELRAGFASMDERLAVLEQLAQRPRVARVIDPARPVETNGGSAR